MPGPNDPNYWYCASCERYLPWSRFTGDTCADCVEDSEE